MDHPAMEVNGGGGGAVGMGMGAGGGGVLDFVQRFQQLQLQRVASEDLIKVGRLVSENKMCASGADWMPSHHRISWSIVAVSSRSSGKKTRRSEKPFAMPSSIYKMLLNLGETFNKRSVTLSNMLVLCLSKMSI